MKKLTLSALLLALGTSAATLFAQDAPTASIQSTPPPPPPPSNAAPAEPVRVDGLIVVDKLPTSAQLLRDAEAENLVVTRMQQSADRIVVTYQYPGGRTRTFAYTTTLPVDPEADTVSVPPPPAPAPAATSYTVIYEEPAPVYYSYPRYSPRYYDPFGPNVSIGLGLGFGHPYGGYNYRSPGYGYRGGYSHHGRGRHR